MDLPAPVGPTTASAAAGRHGDVDAVEDGTALVVVPELDVLEADFALDPVEADRPLALGDVDGQVQVLEDALEEGQRGLDLDAGREQAHGRAEQALLERDEGDDGAEGDVGAAEPGGRGRRSSR